MWIMLAFIGSCLVCSVESEYRKANITKSFNFENHFATNKSQYSVSKRGSSKMTQGRVRRKAGVQVIMSN